MNNYSPGPWVHDGTTTLMPAFVDVAARTGIVAKVWVGDEFQDDHKEGLANLRLILNAPELLAVAQKLVSWGCQYQYVFAEGCVACGKVEWCPFLTARALLEKITGQTRKEKTAMPKRKREFAWGGSGKVLWCGKQHANAIVALDGVANLHRSAFSQDKYYIDFDPRYDTEEVVAAIEAIIRRG